jgi:hypothetical protein
VWLPEDDDELVTSLILVGLCLPVREGRERERESQVNLVSYFEEHSPGVTMTREFHFVLELHATTFPPVFLLNCCYFEV